MLLSIIQEHLAAAEETPLLLHSWSSLIASDDLCAYSDLTGATSQLLIQSLLYRLRRCAEEMDLDRNKESIKVKRREQPFILLIKLCVFNLCCVCSLLRTL